MNVAEFIDEECKRQGRFPEGVAGMDLAWAHADRRALGLLFPYRSDLLTMAHLIEPELNRVDQYRSVNVRVGGRVCPDWTLVNGLMDEWFNKISGRTPDQNYYELMLIHPWADGNGRTGKVVYNWLRGTITDPVFPPDFFGCANP